jgi:plastocyanin
MWKRALVFCSLSLAVSAGEIVGTVTVNSSPGARKVGQTKASAGYEKGDVPPPSESEVENVVIYLQGSNLKGTPLTKMGPGNTILQKNKEFVPHVLPIIAGSKVYFRNQDPFPHHVYSVSQPGSFEIAKHGSSVRSKEFEGSGEVEIFCGVHTKMNAYILVLDNDQFCVPSREGKYSLRGVPAGDYQLMLWHPRLQKAQPRKVSVPSSGVVKLDLVF